jgi:aminoglycoside phosphotransferase (APT) family kinase protein
LIAHPLLYNPAQRASFMLTTPHGHKRLVLKLVCADTFEACVAKHTAIMRSPLPDQLSLPRLIIYALQEQAVFLEYLQGIRLDQLAASQRMAILPWLCEAMVEALSAIHQATLPAFPQWSAADEIGKTHLLVTFLGQHDPQAADVIEPVFERLAARLLQHDYRSTTLIHNDFSAKNLLYRPAEASAARRLAILDWDSAVLGPPEKDVATLLSGPLRRQIDQAELLQLYQRKTGRALDHQLVTTLVQYQRLVKLCRRVAAGDHTEAMIADVAQDIEKHLDQPTTERSA